jgi:hypothetical protein
MEKRLLQFLSHRGYPKKRYRLEDKICGYCEKSFGCIDDLKCHLRKNCCFIPQFHHSHLKLYEKMGLSDEVIHQTNMKKCPSILCNYVFESPSQLILHFDRLGVTQKGLEGQDVSEKKLPYKYFPSEHCVICYEEIPSVVYIECGHSNICTLCYTKIDSEICPFCRTSSNYVLVHHDT